MNKKILRKVFAIVLMLVIMFQTYLFGEPVLATVTATDDVQVSLTVDSGITISDGLNVVMDPNIGITANSSIGNSSWIVRTNNATGYTLAVKADAAPALRVIATPANNFQDYTEAAGICSDLTKTTRVTCEAVPAIWTPTPEPWFVASGGKEFGYSAYGTDTLDATWGAFDTCGASGAPGGNNYAGFKMTDNVIAQKATVTPTSGITTNICFAAEQKDIYAPTGSYIANITATAATL